eukprot:TRINITY_DN25219_c0_g1_i1.p1 TRINITY_DN25219_c0_g1~~TRINITY_DN25219_c0_g1_i1.p1  ORF type:complete len:314 (+),score=85.43 TRINITY_DN25219_c0_g1_i1:88-1029(+)
MILLEYHNKIIEDTLIERLGVTDGKWETLEAVIADFDGVTFHIFTDANNKGLLNISMNMKGYRDMKSLGVDDIMKKFYPSNLTSTENGYDVTLQVDCSKKPADIPKFAREIALVKRNALAAPFYKTFADIEAKKPAAPLIEIKYRDDETIYLKQENDRLIVIFTVQFKDQDDVVFAKVFLQEYQDARKNPQMSSAPSVMFSQKEPPLELKGVKNLRVTEGQSFVSFVLHASHITGAKKEKTIDNIQTFRNYLHYHIKCSKAYMHTRMRNRVKTFLQVLNRAKSEVESAEKKTITGKTFRRADEPASADEEFNI